MTIQDKVKFFDRIDFLGFPLDSYYQEQFIKSQLVFHYTVSPDGAMGDKSWWESRKYKIGTAGIITADGTLNQLFNFKFYANHIGAGHILEKHSIGIEFDRWGPLIKKDGIYYPKAMADQNYWKYTVPKEEVLFLDKPWRGHTMYHAFTAEQIETARLICLYCNDKFKIPLDYHPDMFDVSEKALNGVPGVWTHASYLPASSRQDCMPQPEFVNMLKSLK